MGFNFDDFMSTRAGFGQLFDNSMDDAFNTAKDTRSLYGGMELPSTFWEQYNPQGFNPDMAQANTISEDPMVRSAQLSALAKMSGLADTGLSDVDQAGFAQARQEAGRTGRQGVQNALANANARGMSGSGMEFALRQKASQDAAERQSMAGMNQAAEAAKQRAMYNQAYGEGMSNLRGQDLAANSANANILNQFNMANTQAKNQAGMYNSQLANQAQQYNQQGRRDMQQQRFANQMGRMGGMAAGNENLGNMYAAQNAARSAGRKQDADLFSSMMSMGMSGGKGGK